MDHPVQYSIRNTLLDALYKIHLTLYTPPDVLDQTHSVRCLPSDTIVKIRTTRLLLSTRNTPLDIFNRYVHRPIYTYEKFSR